MESNYVYNEWASSNLVCRPFADALDSMPEVESYSLTYAPANIKYFDSWLFKKKDGKEIRYAFATANNTAISAINGTKVDGDIEWNDQDKNGKEGYIIPANIAKEYFGTEKAKDSVMEYVWDGKPKHKIVRGVYADFPANSEFVNRIYRNINNEDGLSLDCDYNCIVKFKTVPSDWDDFEFRFKQSIIELMKTEWEKENKYNIIPIFEEAIDKTNFKFTPLANSYFEHSSFSTSDRGYHGMLYILIISCLLLIVIATINFLNFTLAESPMRVRGLNTRMVLGASRESLRKGIVSEGIMISVLACILAIAVCGLISALPVYGNLTEGYIALTNHWKLALLMLGIAVVLGIAASVYPGFYATSFQPVLALKGTFGLTPQGRRLRKILVGMQLFISMLMVIYIGVLYAQIDYIYKSNYGYNKENLLIAQLSPWEDSVVIHRFYDELINLQDIEKATFSENPIGLTDRHNFLLNEHKGKLYKHTLMHTDGNFLSTMGINLIEGRDFVDSDTAAIIFNQAALEHMKWLRIGDTIPISSIDEDADSAIVVGVCENIRFSTTRVTTNTPFGFVLKKDDSLCVVNIRVATNADHESVKQQVDELMKKYFGETAIEANYFNDLLKDKTYENEFRYVNMIGLISVICLIITLIGVFCITLFETEYRRKEIGIRKVSGATTSEIIWMLCRHYVPYILISFVIATPLALYFGWLTLRYFNQHVDLVFKNLWWIPPLALLLVGGVTMGTVVLQSWRSARENPVNSIKTE